MITMQNNDEIFKRFKRLIDEIDFSGLTKRQIEVLELVSLGFSNDAIASELSISKETVKTHLKALYRLFESVKDENEPSTLRLKLAFLWLIKNNKMQIPLV